MGTGSVGVASPGARLVGSKGGWVMLQVSGSGWAGGVGTPGG
jgi:hypothetical protein